MVFMDNSKKARRFPQKISKMRSLHKILLFSTFVISFLLYKFCLNYFFFQDDWFVLNWVKNQNILSFFALRQDIIYWRPISMPLLFFSLDKLFPMNAYAFHVVSFVIFFALIFSTYKLFLLLTKDSKLASLAAFFYGTWPIHYISLSWFSTTSYIIGPLLANLSFYFFILGSNSKKHKTYTISFVFFLLGIASSELVLVMPLIFVSYLFFFKKKIIFKYLLPFVVVDLVYFFVRFFLYPIPAKGDYEISIGLQALNNFIWYVLWGLGFPESFKYLIFPSLPKEALRIFLQFWQVTLYTFIFSILIAPKIIKYAKDNFRNFSFAIFWFTIGILPVIFVTNHSYPLYLSLAGLGFIFLLIQSLKKINNYFLAFLIFVWILLSYQNLKFTKNTHWIRNEQAISRAYIDYTQKKVKNPPKNSVFVFKPANLNFSTNHKFFIVEGEDTLKTSLSDQNAMQVIFNDSTIKSFYYDNRNASISLPPDTQILEIAPSTN